MAKRNDPAKMAAKVASYGRYGDTDILHVNRHEIEALEATGLLTYNPHTGKPEAFLQFLLPLLMSAGGSAAAGAMGLGTLGTLGLSAAGSALGTKVSGGSWKDALLAGGLSFGLGALAPKLGLGAKPTPNTPPATGVGIGTPAAPDLSLPTPEAFTKGTVAPPSFVDPIPAPSFLNQPMTEIAASGAKTAVNPFSSVKSFVSYAKQPNVLMPAMFSAASYQPGASSSKKKKKKDDDAAPVIMPPAYIRQAIPLDDYSAPASTGERMQFRWVPNPMVKGVPELGPDYVEGTNPNLALRYGQSLPTAFQGAGFDYGQQYGQKYGLGGLVRTVFNDLANPVGFIAGKLGIEGFDPTGDFVFGSRSRNQDWKEYLRNNPGEQRYAEGGEVQGVGLTPSRPEQDVVGEAAAAIMGQHPDPEGAITRFVQAYGEEALDQLVAEVRASASGDGRLAQGPGGGRDDSIPAVIDGQEPAAISSGEYIIPADVVSHLGDGSSDEGGRALDAMIKDVRAMKTGRGGAPRKISKAALPA